MRTLAHAQPLVGEQGATSPTDASRAGWVAFSAYLILGATLLASRLVALDRSFWSDEIVTVTDYVRAGPREILTGPYIPNNHELFSLLAWATSSIAGESEVTLRLLAVIPFLVGVVVVTSWLHKRVSPLSAVLFLFFAAASPMLFDLSRQARGYGLAFLAMSVLIVSALEAARGESTRVLAIFFAAGVVGTTTLPNFGLAFVATGLALMTVRALVRRLVVGIAGSMLVIAAWYAPHARDLLSSSQQEYGAPIPWLGLPTSPVDEVLLPGLLWFGDTFLATYPARAIVIGVCVVLLLSSPLLRERTTALVLCSGVAATLVFVWATRLYLAPRFLSYLLVPLFILFATGAAHVLSSAGLRARPRALMAMLAIVVAAAAFVGAASHLLRYPSEAWKEAAAAIETAGWSQQPIVMYVAHPQGLRYYLSAAVVRLQRSDVVETVCGARRPIVYVESPYDTEAVDVPCLEGEGVRHIRLRQHSYGGEVNVWLVPARR